ncbi:hypothetical protein MC885_004756 [Smutsia gigantea]|nr:hypothetical protein MC885_004756 [Smutsia gigantea]
MKNYMNDSLRTDVFVRFQPESIACACIYLAARTLEIPLPNRPHWFLLFGATEEEIQEICLKILQLYTRKKVDLTHLESEVEKRKHAIEEAKAQAKGLLPGGTQALDGTSGFSPVPKLGGCRSESPKAEGKGNKASPLSVKNAKRKMEGVKKAKTDSPVNGLPKGRGSRSRSGSREQSFSRSPSRSASPKRRKSDSGSTSGGSKSQSRSRSRSDSPPRQAHRGAPYKGSKVRSYRKSKDCKYSTQKPHKSRSRSSSRSRSHSRERADNSGKYKKKSHYYRDQHRERSRSYERTGHRYERDHPGHSRHRSSPGRSGPENMPDEGCSRPGPVSDVLGSHARRPCYSIQPTGPSGVASLRGRGIQLELEEMLVPRKMSISPLESWLTSRYLLPRLDAGASAQLYECPPRQVGEVAEQGGEGVWDASWMQCKNILKIRRRKMNHHKYLKLVKRTRFLRRKVLGGRLKRKQMKFERDLRRIWLKAGLKEAPAGWQTPKIYLKGR